MKIQLLNADTETKVFGLLAGKAGVGKTTQATTFPKEETLIVSLERGLLSLKGSGFAAVEITTYDELLAILTNPKTIASWAKYIVVDSLSEIYDLLNRELRQKFTAKQNFQKFEERQDKLFHAIRTAKQLDLNVFFICHTKEEKNGLALEENLAFDGKLPEDIKKQFDTIVHMQVVDGKDGKKERLFYLSPEVSTVAKLRKSPWLNIEIKDIEEPNLFKLCNKLTGKGEN